MTGAGPSAGPSAVTGAVTGSVPAAGAPLRLRGRVVAPGRPAVMAVVNRTRDSFYAAARLDDDAAAIAAVARAVAGRRGPRRHRRRARRARGAGRRRPRRCAASSPFVARVRAEHPGLLVSVDTWRAEVAREAARAGAGPGQRHLGRARPDPRRGRRRGGRRGTCARTPAARCRAPTRSGSPTPCAAPRSTRAPHDPRDGVLDDVVRTLRCRGAARRARSASTRRRCSSTRPTTSARTPGTRLHLRPAHRGARRARATRCSWRCPARTSSGRPSDLAADERLEGTLARDRGRRLARGAGVPHATTCARPGGPSTWSPPSAATVRRSARSAGWRERARGRDPATPRRRADRRGRWADPRDWPAWAQALGGVRARPAGQRRGPAGRRAAPGGDAVGARVAVVPAVHGPHVGLGVVPRDRRGRVPRRRCRPGRTAAWCRTRGRSSRCSRCSRAAS